MTMAACSLAGSAVGRASQTGCVAGVLVIVGASGVGHLHVAKTSVQHNDLSVKLLPQRKGELDDVSKNKTRSRAS